MKARRLSRPGWLVTSYTELVYLPTDIHHTSTNRARRRVTSLIGYNPLPLRHAAILHWLATLQTIIDPYCQTAQRVCGCLSLCVCAFAADRRSGSAVASQRSDQLVNIYFGSKC